MEDSVKDPITFASLDLDAKILRAIEEAGYTTPTPIQAQAIPHVLAGRDLMAMAQTGTGKTAAFTLPLLQRLLPHASTSVSPARHPIRALILAPTRELAIQVEENVVTYRKHVPLRSTVVYGGVDIKTQKPALMQGVEILVATPGRLLDHVESKNLQLNQVQTLILDEADRMLDMGFMPDLKRILTLLPKQRQTLLFSATFSDEIKKLAQDFLVNPITVEAARRNTAAETVKQSVLLVDQDKKFHVLAELIRNRGVKQVLVFTRTKISASRLTRLLDREGIPADAIHGDKSQQERIKALDAFKEGKITALVATDVAARGIDIDQLPLVVNYELPPNAEDYVHRIGRTGRAGASGEAISLVDGEEEKLLQDVEKLLKRQFPRERAQINSYSRPRSSERKPRSAEEEWFYKPYEPSPNAGMPAERPALRQGKAKKQIAALLGGLSVKH
ncbi:ATP-dependent RNA helicase [Novimethylophilus kurashikiensis]|uniref:DEAD-box ATP-dependent RNA helicase RhpA n=1 Tax=Novimethylophilus kurashikiensis TaxID=1825523 RepID=A0A2R5F219_9PROT|nr:DEAD/DEAH box helicase [Novimethylophilus kurashikiensis]GBG12696.1 ATP-dependent RNA helicase [Novimethylophilus kurashikiensis]